MQSSNDGPALVELSLANAGAVARASTGRRAAAPGEESEDGDDFFSAILGAASSPFSSPARGGDDESGDDESGDDFFGAFFGGGGRDEKEPPGDGFLSGLLGGGDPASGDGFLSSILGLPLGGGEGDGSEGGGEDVFPGMMALGGVFMDNVERCGIDMAEMSGKALTAFLMFGSSIDLSSPKSFTGLDAVQPIFLALKDDDEEECSVASEAALLSASEEYLQCTDAKDFFDGAILTDPAIQDVKDDCKSVYNMVAAGDIDNLEQDFREEDSATSKSSVRCLKTALGDNDAGNYVREAINNVDKVFDCMNGLGESVPRCVMSFQNEGGEPFSLPLSLLKKTACLVGSSYKNIIEMACVEVYKGLDTCLPRNGEGVDDRAISRCADEQGGLPLGKQEGLLGMDASVLTGDKIPDFCSNVFEDKGMDVTDVQSRLDYYNQNREYGWTIDLTMQDVSNVAEVIAETKKDEGFAKDEVPGESQDFIYAKSNPISISSEDEAAPDNDDPVLQNIYLALVASGLFIVGTVALALRHYKYRGSGANHGRSPTESSSNFSHNSKQYANVTVDPFDAEFA